MDKIDFNKIYSVSKLKLFELCPKQYHFTYIDEVYSKMKAKLRKDPDNQWPFNTLGKAVHDSITLYLHLSKSRQDLDHLKSQLKLAWRSEAMPRKLPPLDKWGGFSNLDEERVYYKEALNMLINFYKNFKLEGKVKFLPTQELSRSIEDYKRLIKPLNDDYSISGKFDLVLEADEGLQVVDFKTSKNEEKDEFQLKFYKLLAELNFDNSVSKASFYYLRTSKIKEYQLINEDQDKIKKIVLDKINKIKDEEQFATRPSKLCRYCLFRNFCPAKKEIAQYLKEPLQEEFVEDLPF